MTPEEEQLKPDLQSREKMSTWTFLKKSRSSRRALLVSIVLYTAAIFQGLIVVQVYAEPLFKEAVPSMSSTLSSIILAIVAVVSGFIGAYLVEKLGRRLLITLSSIATGICCVILATQIQYHWGPHWMTMVFMNIFCVSYSLGAGIVPFVVVGEVFLPEIRGLASMIATEWAYICNFLVLFIFNPIVTNFGLGPVFYMFAVASFLTAGFCTIYLPETRGLPVDAIQELFTKKK